MIKTRYAESLGLLSRESSWQLGSVVDFSGVVFAGATTERQVAAVIPVTNPSHAMGSPDNYPTELGPSLTAIVNGRQISTGAAPFAVLTGVFVAHVTAAGAVYAPAATTTVQVKVSSTFTTAVGAATNLTGAFNVTTGANGIDPVTITAPADRQVGLSGTPLATVAQLFNGDVLFVELVTTGALTVDPNIFAVMLEWM